MLPLFIRDLGPLLREEGWCVATSGSVPAGVVRMGDAGGGVGLGGGALQELRSSMLPVFIQDAGQLVRHEELGMACMELLQASNVMRDDELDEVEQLTALQARHTPACLSNGPRSLINSSNM